MKTDNKNTNDKDEKNSLVKKFLDWLAKGAKKVNKDSASCPT